MNKQLNNVIKELERTIPDALEQAKIIAGATAVDYYKNRFTVKRWGSTPWKPSHSSTGSTLVKSGHLMQSIRVVRTTKSEIVISAGNAKVNYAQAHNEGVNKNIKVHAHHRRTRRGKDSLVKSHNRHMQLPKRQFMGVNNAIQKKIVDRISKNIKL